MSRVATGALGALGALLLCSLALRPQLVGVGPLVSDIGDDLGVSHAVAGLLGTIPVLCMGVFAPSAARVSARLGTRAAIAACLAAIAVFGLARSAAPDAQVLLALTFPIGVGIGLAGALLPVAVKERYAHRPAFATGVYAVGINIGAATSAALAVPLADAGSWRTPLAVFSAFTFVVLAGWLALTRDTGRPAATARPRLPLRTPIVWALVALFAMMSVVYYGFVAWLPDAYVERGWSEHSAGALLAAFNFAQLPAALVVPWLADLGAPRRRYLLAGATVLALGALGIAATASAAWLFVVLTGLGIGTLFPLVMTLPLDVADRPAAVGAVAGMMLGAGYSMGALGPLLLGAARDATGSFDLTLWLIAADAVLLLACCVPLGPARLRRRPHLDAVAR